MDGQYIDRHKYNDFVVQMSVELYINFRLGLRCTSAMIEYLSRKLGWELESIPSPVSIKNWVEKSGYSIYRETAYSDSQPYAQIIDESMMIGSQRLMLSLGIDAQKTGDKALRFEDVKILDISVSPVWTAEKTGEVLEKVSSANGSPPKYLISDNASILTKAARDKAMTRLPDVGHTMALFVEQVYKKDENFKSFCKEIAEVKFREIMRATAYLLPPKQRSIARFMNLSITVEWADKMLHSLPRLTAEEQKVFGFIKRYPIIINELKGLFEQINGISEKLKKEGLSYKSADKLMKEIKILRASSSSRPRQVLDACTKYLKELRAKLPDENTVWHVSSDILESMFGYTKIRKSPNPLNGVTTQIFILPVLTKKDSRTGFVDIDFKRALESVFLRDLNDWRIQNLTENLVVKRTKILKTG